ncbi:DUF1534 domain-containing protein [Pseudomonas cannabina]|nr:DUF1534 domain-containing protein [Pseudomonas cannabina]
MAAVSKCAACYQDCCAGEYSGRCACRSLRTLQRGNAVRDALRRKGDAERWHERQLSAR